MGQSKNTEMENDELMRVLAWICDEPDHPDTDPQKIAAALRAVADRAVADGYEGLREIHRE